MDFQEDAEVNLYYVVFVAGTSNAPAGATQFEMFVHAEDVNQVESVCEREVSPLMIASFERKTLYRKPRAVFISKRRVK